MKQKRTSERRRWNLLLFTHTIVWLMGWGLGIHIASISDYSQTFVAALFLLMWTLLFVIHIGAFYYTKGRADATDRERLSYRDGYNDAIRELMNSDRAFDARHLTLDEDGELVEIQPESKRKNQ
jgi:hypothetical protein